MHTTRLLTSLQALIDELTDHGAQAPSPEPSIIAFWDTPSGESACRLLPQATTALQHCFTDHGFDTGPEDDRLTDRWVRAALAGPATEWCHPRGGQLTGIGLIAAAVGDFRRLRAWVACPEGTALVWRRDWHPTGAHGPALLRPVESHQRLEVDTPLWWDEARRLSGLERFRAAITGSRPRLPDAEQSSPTQTPSLSTDHWTGPC